MTIPASARQFSDRLPSATEKQAANQLRKLIASHVTSEAKLCVLDRKTKKPIEIVMTPALSELLMEMLRHIGNGDAVTLVPVSKMLTTQQAADILNVSRPYFISCLEKGEIAFSHVGRHRRVKAEDLFAYKRSRDEKRAEALSTLAEMDEDIL